MRGLLLAGLGLALSAPGQEIRLTRIAAGLAAPTDIQSANDGSGRLFFVQQNGLVRLFRDGALAAQPFLDIRNRTRAGGERGLLGLAFPPGFSGKQRFYVNYTDLNGDTIVAMYRVSPNPDLADAASESVLLKIQQPFSNHNGGQLRFGPDGYLYIGMGDGGSAGDPRNNGQNPGSLLGKMLRVDVESEPGAVRIPPDNPFASSPGARPEIWALGLRNPWRYSFDRATGDLWIADVGQNAWEEINFQPASSRGGENYGWNLMEGAHCYRAGCSTQGLTLPVAEYGRSEGCSVTGGFVYRGAASPALRGAYIYGDYCSGKIWGLAREGSQWRSRLLAATGFAITTFGEDEAGEIYVADARDGAIHRIDGDRAPALSVAAVVNAASFAPGMTPGSLATAFVTGVMDGPGAVSSPRLPLERTLSGVSLSVGGIRAPILALANLNGLEQINFQVPFELRGRSTAAVVVTREGRTSAPVETPVLEVQPAVYTSDGASAIVVRNSDFTLASPERPLSREEYAFLYAAGLGRAANEPPTGAAAPLAPLASLLSDVRVTLAGLTCEVQFAGLAPAMAGVYQVNFRVPPGAPSGVQELVLEAAGVQAPAVRVAIR